MNGYELTEKLRKARRRHHLSAATQALYHELVAICNEEGWNDTFKCSNGELCTALCIDEKTLTKHRLTLIQSGLLSYKSGQSKRAVGIYSFVKQLETTGKIPTNPPTNRTTNVPANPPANRTTNPPTNAPDLNKTKRKTETETKQSFVADEPPPPKKKGDAGGKEKSLYWDVFVKTFQDFYTRELGREPYEFTNKDFGCLKKIYEFLQKRAKLKNFDWTEDNMTGAFKFFLNAAKNKDNWMRENFSIPNLLSQFNQIANGGQQQGGAGAPGGKSAAGAKIDGAQLDEAFAEFYKKAG